MTRELAVQRLRPAGMVQEMADRQRHVDVAALADRLAVVDRFQHREQALMPLHGAADGVEHLGALVAGRARSTRARPCAAAADRRIDVGIAGLRDAWPALAGRRVAGRRRSCRHPPRNPFAADEQRLAKNPGRRARRRPRCAPPAPGRNPWRYSVRDVHGQAPRAAAAAPDRQIGVGQGERPAHAIAWRWLAE